MNKNYLLSLNKNKNQNLNKLVTEDSLRFKELLFDDSLNHNGLSRGGLNISEGFIVENENLIKISTPQNPSSVRNARGWRQNNTSTGNDTINFLKEGVTNNKNEVENFIKGNNIKNNQLVEENNINENNKNLRSAGNLDDTMNNMENNNQNSENFRNEVNTQNSNLNNNSRQMPFPYMMRGMPVPFGMPMGIMPNMPNMHPMQAMPSPTSTEKVEIVNIFLFNDKINFPKDQPLWYLSSPLPSFVLTGPLSSNQLVDMYNHNTFDGNFLFRPLDLFHFNHVNSNKNELVKIKIINEKYWTDFISDSPLLQYTELCFTSKKLLTQSQNVKEQIKESTHKNEKNEKKEFEMPKPTRNFNEETLNLTQLENKKEINKFMDDDDDEIIQPPQTNLNETSVTNIVRDIDNSNWEVVDKKKKKINNNDEFYLIGNKSKKEVKKETKPISKVDIVPPEELVKNLKPKHLREENNYAKPNYDAFYPTSESNKKSAAAKKKGKPQELNIKLGFKI